MRKERIDLDQVFAESAVAPFDRNGISATLNAFGGAQQLSAMADLLNNDPGTLIGRVFQDSPAKDQAVTRPAPTLVQAAQSALGGATVSPTAGSISAALGGILTMLGL